MTTIEARGRPVTVLFIEDSPSDVLMTRETLDQAKVLIDLHVIDNGIDALSFLRREGRYPTAPRPDLILLDLNLPKKDGREVLREIKSDEAFKRIPVVILTSSSAEEDVMRAYGLHANCYVTKNFDFEGLAKVVRSIERFWFTVVTLPEG